jgi:hypothetical protein
MAFSRSRKLANIGKAIDSGVSGDFLGLDDSGGIFKDVQWNDITGKPTILDSAATIAIIDSAYVQARQTDVGIDSAQITNLIDSAYVQLRVGDAGLDSAAATGIIDSAYVAARVTAGLDSAGTLNLVDSDYISDRASASSGFEYFKYIATAGQTVFDSTDEYGNTLSYGTDNILVFYNGVLMLPTYDYTTSGGTTVTLNEGADSGIPVTIGKWAVASSSSAASGLAWGGDRALSTDENSLQIDYFDMTTTTNAADFGDLTQNWDTINASFSDGSRGVLHNGNSTTPPTTNLEYVTIATTGNATNFGNGVSGTALTTGASDGTYGLIAGGTTFSPNLSSNQIAYVTIQTTGNAADFGDLTVAKTSGAGVSNSTYGVFAGGNNYDGNNFTYSNVIDYVTIATPGNATDFGDLGAARQALTGFEDATRGVFAGGRTTTSDFHNTMEYITVNTTSNTTDFGDLSAGRSDLGAAGNGTRGVIIGGIESPWATIVNTVEYVTVQTTGNATDLLDLSQSASRPGAFSGNPS